MPVTFELQENGSLMYWKLEDPWTLPELIGYYKQAESIFDNAPHMVHSLVDVQHVRQIPGGVLSARHAKTWHHPRSGQTVIVGATPLIKAMVETLFQLVRFNRVRFFNDEVEARNYLLRLIEQEVRLNS